jgi:uncharacterized protein YraI
MTNRFVLGATTALVALAIPGVALAASATVTTDLNVRAGPGPQFEVVGVLPADQTVEVTGCIEGSLWCQVAGESGWVYSEYLSYNLDGNVVSLRTAAPQIQTPVVTYEPDATGTVASIAGGATVGALVGGPVGAAVGGAAGAVVGALASPPPPQVQSYIVEQPVEPVYLDGEVVVGARVPDSVQLYTVPEYDYPFAYINQQRVLVDPQGRQIVYVLR